MVPLYWYVGAFCVNIAAGTVQRGIHGTRTYYGLIGYPGLASFGVKLSNTVMAAAVPVLDRVHE
jgi:hypothetical protein